MRQRLAFALLLLSCGPKPIVEPVCGLLRCDENGKVISAPEGPFSFEAGLSGGREPVYSGINNALNARILQDGRYIWRTQEKPRTYLSTQLTENERQDIADTLAQAGFFSWDDSYRDETLADGQTFTITARGATITKQVSDYGYRAPRAFHDLFLRLSTGWDKTGSPYTPQSATVVAVAAPSGSTGALAWPTTAGFDLSEGMSAKPIEEPALSTVWTQLNSNQGTVYESKGSYFYVGLKDPNLQAP